MRYIVAIDEGTTSTRAMLYQKQKDGLKAGMHKIDYVQSNDRLGFKM